MDIEKWGCYGCGYLDGMYCEFLEEELKKDSYCPEYMGAIDIGLTFPEYQSEIKGDPNGYFRKDG